jgi:hypothetical protein
MLLQAETAQASLGRGLQRDGSIAGWTEGQSLEDRTRVEVRLWLSTSGSCR